MTCWNVTSVAAIFSGSHHSTLAPESIGVNGERATMSVFLQLTVAITGAVLIPDHVGLLFTSMCVRERERERESVCVCVRERERECLCV